MTVQNDYSFTIPEIGHLPRKARNILFIMFDQLRFDYLSCAGHPHLHTPHIDSIAERGVRFSRAYVQSPVCGASRMSFYTGRYVHSHGASYNNVPLKVGEITLGDHLRDCGMKSWLIGKTHMKVDDAGMERLGIAKDSVIGARVSECGFDIFDRDDGLWGEGPGGLYDQRRSPYNEYLRQQGYEADNPWHENANASVNDDGNIESGWFMKHADKPANIREEHSETPWLTGRAIEFIKQRDKADDGPWLCHLSYIKPHWPYIVPAPYHNMYGHNHIQPVVRSKSEKQNPHPVYEQFMNGVIGQAFSRDEVRDKVVPAYMGLIKQCDDQMGRLFKYLEQSGHMNDTMIVITSDHGDYMGDHWMGEKDLFHDPSVKVPLIIFDPSSTADATRGSVCDALVESIDLAATFIETAGSFVPGHIVEGKSLRPFIEGNIPRDWRNYAISEYDYASSPICKKLGLETSKARLFMVATTKWKMMHADGGFRPMLFDLENDPDELTDLGDNPEYDKILIELYGYLAEWARRPSQRTTISDSQLKARQNGGSENVGIFIGIVDEKELSESLTQSVLGRAKQNFLKD